MSFFTTKVLTYISGGLLIALIAAGVWIKLAEAKAQHNFDEWEKSEIRLTVSNGSVARQGLELDRLAAEAIERGERLRAVRQAAQEDQVRHDALRQAMTGRIASLEAQRGEINDNCPIPEGVLSVLD